jgi:hypothetical protein
LSNVNVRAWIDLKLAHQAEKYEITRDRITRELALLAFSNMADYTRSANSGADHDLDLEDLTRDQMAAISEFTVDTIGGGTGDGERRRILRTRIKLCPKVPALQLLGSSLKLFTTSWKSRWMTRSFRACRQREIAWRSVHQTPTPRQTQTIVRDHRVPAS